MTTGLMTTTGGVMNNILEIRKTHRYRDGWSYEDEWEEIGEFEVMARGEKAYDDESYEEAFTQNLFVHVKSEASEEDIRRALQNTLSGSSCRHDYDCCGCYSYYAVASPLTRDYWLVKYSGSRNY